MLLRPLYPFVNIAYSIHMNTFTLLYHYVYPVIPLRLPCYTTTFTLLLDTSFVIVSIMHYYNNYLNGVVVMEMSELVVKGNALIEASYTLGLAEQRLILLAILEARETGQGIDHNSLLRVHAYAYAEQFRIDKGNSYEVIKDASKGL